jgi:sodium pump decarboxylase gamma subunit
MAELLETGFVLMLTGMGTVFVLLTVLVSIVQAVSKLCHWLAPPVAPAVSAATALPSGAAVDRELLLVIGAAVKAHRERRHPR